jgi:hypothetical protein
MQQDFHSSMAPPPTLKFPTLLLWAIVKTRAPKFYETEDYAEVAAYLYPGIAFQTYEDQEDLAENEKRDPYKIRNDLAYILDNFARSDIWKLHPDLLNVHHEENVIAEMGEYLELQPIKRCQGYDWKKWPPIPKKELDVFSRYLFE